MNQPSAEGPPDEGAPGRVGVPQVQLQGRHRPQARHAPQGKPQVALGKVPGTRVNPAYFDS